MSDLQAIADRVEIEALRGGFTDAAMIALSPCCRRYEFLVWGSPPAAGVRSARARETIVPVKAMITRISWKAARL